MALTYRAHSLAAFLLLNACWTVKELMLVRLGWCPYPLPLPQNIERVIWKIIYGKREYVTLLIPYYMDDAGKVIVFVQKRSRTVRYPGQFGLFGGRIRIDEGEEPEQGLQRESIEELGFKLSRYHYAGAYRNETTTALIFLRLVDSNFHQRVTIDRQESESGAFTPLQQAIKNPLFIPGMRFILSDLHRKNKFSLLV